MKTFIEESPIKDTAPATELLAVCYQHFLNGTSMCFEHIVITTDTEFKHCAQKVFNLKPSTIDRIVDKITAKYVTVDNYRFLHRELNKEIAKYKTLEEAISKLVRTYGIK